MGTLTKLGTTTEIPGTPAKPAIPAMFAHIFAPPSPPGTRYQFAVAQNGFTQLTKTGVLPGTLHPAPQPWMTYIRFPGVPTLANGFPAPEAGNGPLTGEFDAPSLDGYIRVTRQYYREGRYGSWVARWGTFVDPPFLETGGPEGQTRVKDFPGFPGAPAVPASTLFDPNIGWNSGANSIGEIAGDAELTLTMAVGQVSAIAGIALAPRVPTTSIDSILYGFRFYTDGGGRWLIRDNGRELSFASNSYTEDTVFKVRRYQGQVSFLVDDTVVYISPNLSYGTLCAATALYHAGDSIGDGA